MKLVYFCVFQIVLLSALCGRLKFTAPAEPVRGFPLARIWKGNFGKLDNFGGKTSVSQKHVPNLCRYIEKQGPNIRTAYISKYEFFEHLRGHILCAGKKPTISGQQIPPIVGGKTPPPILGPHIPPLIFEEKTLPPKGGFRLSGRIFRQFEQNGGKSENVGDKIVGRNKGIENIAKNRVQIEKNDSGDVNNKFWGTTRENDEFRYDRKRVLDKSEDFFRNGMLLGENCDNKILADKNGGENIDRNCDLPMVYSGEYTTRVFPSKHRFRMQKFAYIYERVRGENVYTPTYERERIVHKLELAHSAEYVDHVMNGKLSAKAVRKLGLPFTKEVIHRFLTDLSGTLLAVQLALKFGLASNLGGGTHHAFSDQPGVFSPFNDIAVAALHATNHLHTQRVLIIDADVHQGDGTAEILKKKENIFTLSFHCQDNFPFTKQESDLDIGFDAGVGDAEYLPVYQWAVEKVVEEVKPNLVIYVGGADVHEEDSLGKLNISTPALFWRDFFTLSHLAARRIPVATLIGGGYHPDPRQLAKTHNILIQAAQKVWNSMLRHIPSE